MATIDFERVFAALPGPHMLLDRNFNYVAANAAYCGVTMRSWDELRGRNLFDLFPNDGASGNRLRESFEKVFATGESDTLAYIPYDIPRPEALGGGMEVRFWTAVHVPIQGADGRVEFLMQNSVDVTDIARLREAASLPFRTRTAETSLLERAREAESANRQLLAESEDFRRLFQQAPGFFAVMSGADHHFTFASDSYLRLVGGRQVIGKPLREALPEVVEQGFVDLLDDVYRNGTPHNAEGARVLLANEPELPPTEVFLDFSYAPIRAVDGSVTGVFVQGMDRTESVRAQRRQRLLIDELNHRVKNTLAIVQSIATQTLRTTSDAEGARKAFESRIVALARAHNLLSERSWSDTEIGALLGQELGAFEGTQVRFGGPVLVVNAKTTIALALLLHELATNAVKHGALSVAEGSLSVNWHEAANDDLVIDWRELGGPPVSPPSRRGFGSRMLSTVVSGELGGSIDTSFSPGGFSATLSIPASVYRQKSDAHA